jgi:branched-subunit amino acid transport protein
MDVRGSVLLVIALSALVTVIPRVAPFVLLSRAVLPGWVARWLDYVPIAVLAALFAQEVTVAEGRLALPPNNLGLIAAVPTLLIALTTRSLIATVASGVVAMALLRRLVG